MHTVDMIGNREQHVIMIFKVLGEGHSAIALKFRSSSH